MKRPAKVSGALLALSLPIIPAPANAVEPTFGEIAGAVVRVNPTIMPSAQTTRSLGKERSDSGVVINDDVLIQTIGYLIIKSATLAPVYAAASQGQFTGDAGADVAPDILSFGLQSLEIKKVVICSRDRYDWLKISNS